MPLYVSVGIYAVAGVLIGIITYVIGRIIKKDMRIVGVVAFVAAIFLIRIYVYPVVGFWYFEKSFNKIPVYNTISEVEPNLYNSIQQDLKNMLAAGKSEEQIKETIHFNILKLFEKHFPTASDEAVIRSVSVTVEELKQLQAMGADLCIKFLLPAGYNNEDLSGYINKELQLRDAEATHAVILSGLKNPQPPPDPKVAKKLLTKIAANLQKTYGNNLAIMDNPAKYGSNRNEVCSMTISLYEKALSLPPKEASMLIRYLIEPDKK